MSRGHFRATRRWPPATDDRGSLPLALLVTIIGVGLVALLVPIVIMQNQITRAGASRATALAEAEAGIDVAAGQIRAATATVAGVTAGDPADLPCGPITGSTGQSGGSYTATISYFLEDPSNHTADPDWLAPQTSAGVGNAMQCSPGYGTHAIDSAGDDVYVPSFALIRSTATASGHTRTLYITYKVQTTNRNISGGFIKIFPPADATEFYCMDAGDPSTWAVGSQVRLQTCPTDGITPDRQRWAYNPNLTIQLTTTVDNPDFASLNNGDQGLCLGTSMSSGQSSGQQLTLQACPNDPAVPGDPSASPPVPPQAAQTPPAQPNYRLMWSIDDNSNLVNSNTSGTGRGNLRVYVSTQQAGQQLVLSSGSGSVTSPNYTWVPSPDAGAGQAGAQNKQLVNFAQFGRCLDVTSQNTSSPFLILYTCKQDPNPSATSWNQKFTASPTLVGAQPQTVSWRTDPGSGTVYCLTTSNSTSTYVHVEKCSTNSTATLYQQQRWTVYQTLDPSSAPLAYRYKFTVVDVNGLCLAPGPSTDLYNGQYYKSVVATCDGTTNQKWNADPNVAATGLSNLHEVLGGAAGS